MSDELKGVAPEWRDAFLKFVRTGEASSGFLKYLEESKACQSAVDRALVKQVEEIEGSLSSPIASRDTLGQAVGEGSVAVSKGFGVSTLVVSALICVVTIGLGYFYVTGKQREFDSREKNLAFLKEAKETPLARLGQLESLLESSRKWVRHEDPGVQVQAVAALALLPDAVTSAKEELAARLNSGEVDDSLRKSMEMALALMSPSAVTNPGHPHLQKKLAEFEARVEGLEEALSAKNDVIKERGEALNQAMKLAEVRRVSLASARGFLKGTRDDLTRIKSGPSVELLKAWATKGREGQFTVESRASWMALRIMAQDDKYRKDVLDVARPYSVYSPDNWMSVYGTTICAQYGRIEYKPRAEVISVDQKRGTVSILMDVPIDSIKGPNKSHDPRRRLQVGALYDFPFKVLLGDRVFSWKSSRMKFPPE